MRGSIYDRQGPCKGPALILNRTMKRLVLTIFKGMITTNKLKEEQVARCPHRGRSPMKDAGLRKFPCAPEECRSDSALWACCGTQGLLEAQEITLVPPRHSHVIIHALVCSRLAMRPDL